MLKIIFNIQYIHFEDSKHYNYFCFYEELMSPFLFFNELVIKNLQVYCLYGYIFIYFVYIYMFLFDKTEK